MKKKERKRVSYTAAIMLRIGALFFAIWLMVMSYLTVISASAILDDWKKGAEDTMNYRQYDSYDAGALHWRPSYCKRLHNAVTNTYFDGNAGSYFFSAEGQLIWEEGNYVEIAPERIHIEGGEAYCPSRYRMYVNLDIMPAEFLRVVQLLDTPINFLDVCFYGYYDGGTFVPVKVTTKDHGDDSEQVSYESKDETDRELVCIYFDTMGIYVDSFYENTKTGPAIFNKKTYTNLQEVAQDYYSDLIQGKEQSLGDYSEESLWRSSVALHKSFRHITYTLIPSTNEYEIDYETAESTGIFILVAQCFPILEAMKTLWPYYLQTFLLLSFIILIFWLVIRKHQKEPCSHIMYYANRNYDAVPHKMKFRWRELDELQDYYIQAQPLIHQLQQDNQQLQTALDYARDAEFHRRELVDNVTNAWKKPLANIHDYAKALQKGIPAGQEDAYLNAILDESQKMDTTVMNMLDLSRLEAGKVRLSADQICLSDMTRQIFEKLSPMLQEKGLNVQYLRVYSFQTTADESRIAQVITNMATHAIESSPEGGNIYIVIGERLDKSFLAMGHQCKQLTQEALKIASDSTCSAKASDESNDTGLELAIAKAIVELHRGAFSVSNTSTGVELRFELP